MSVDWLEELLKSGDPPKVVSIVNPGNPSGTYVPEPLSTLFRFLLHTGVSSAIKKYVENTGRVGMRKSKNRDVP